jgi:hypothetical protein
MRKFTTSVFFVFAIAMLATIGGAYVSAGTSHNTDRADGLTVHEWGTFTTVAGPDGQAVNWLPLSGANDLPCFVDHFKDSFPKWSPNGKVMPYQEARAQLKGKVRMETPVLYFYSPREETLDIKVSFQNGFISEWYPPATVNIGGYDIEWKHVKVSPDRKTSFPTEARASHYYKARETDANPIQVAGKDEKFLFYRGLGFFAVPISAQTTSSGSVIVTNMDSEPLPVVILFENRGGKIGYRIQRQFSKAASIDPPQLSGDFDSLRKELEADLTSAGLTEKEAHAMVETWRDSWFEEGARVFYILPGNTVDRILPLSIQPPPAHVARAFVGRMEVITPATIKTVEDAIATNDTKTLSKYGRFLGSIADRLDAKDSRTTELLDSAYKSVLADLGSSCK